MADVSDMIKAELEDRIKAEGGVLVGGSRKRRCIKDKKIYSKKLGHQVKRCADYEYVYGKGVGVGGKKYCKKYQDVYSKALKHPVERCLRYGDGVLVGGGKKMPKGKRYCDLYKLIKDKNGKKNLRCASFGKVKLPKKDVACRLMVKPTDKIYSYEDCDKYLIEKRGKRKKVKAGVLVGGKRGQSEWIDLVKKYRMEHPGISYKQALMDLKGYKKGGCCMCEPRIKFEEIYDEPKPLMIEAPKSAGRYYYY